MIRKFYVPDDPPGADPATTATVAGTGSAAPAAASPDAPAGGGPGTPPPPPKGYTVSTPQQRSDWNGFLDYAGKQGTDLSTAKTQNAALAAYKKTNPNFSITADQIPNIQYEAYQLRNGKAFGNLGEKELGYIRQGLKPNFLNADVSNVGKLYYPQEGNFGTDIEGYYKSKFSPAGATPTATVAGTPATAPTTGSATTSVARTMKSDALVPGAANRYPAAFIAAENTTAPAGGLKRPDYSDPASREQFAQAWLKKYGVEESYGDIPLRVNERPYGGTDTSKNMAIAASKKTGIDPALIYASSMVEGASRTYPDAKGRASYGDDPKYPVQGSAYGLNNFSSRVPEMIKKGYLPKDFDYVKYTPTAEELAKNPKITTDGANFKNANDAYLAHAARLKLDYDEIDDHAKQEGIKLTPQARDFFALAHFNSGLGKNMMDKYAKNGWLKGDQWMKGNPDGSYPEVYKHVILRIKERNALKQENLFDQ